MIGLEMMAQYCHFINQTFLLATGKPLASMQ
jgi:hypothetical protein